jgi:hypothetical protein
MLQSGPAGLIKTEDNFFLRNGLATFQPGLFIKTADISFRFLKKYPNPSILLSAVFTLQANQSHCINFVAAHSQ